MQPAVRAAWWRLNVPIEGAIPHMYLDTDGLVTCGMGRMLATADEACAIVWQNADGAPASSCDVAAAWQTVKAAQGFRKLGARAFEGMTSVVLPDEGLADALAKLDKNAVELTRWFPDFEAWPADAQLGALSLAWACGPDFAPRWPALTAALRHEDYATAATQCFFEHPIGTQVARQEMQRRAFLNAAASTDVSVLLTTAA